MSESILSQALTMQVLGYIGLVPLVIAWLAGIALSVRYWRERPRAAGFCLASMVLLLAWTLLQQVLYLTAYQWGGEFEAARMSVVFSGIGAIGGLVHTLCFGLLLAAVFSGRDTPRE
ncbi:hypothetical protein A7D27_10970 [Pseudomonas sp. 1D4]|uniref:hypothetical protein n=1 Tax=Pseudomonadaceae TaxID=135621 RepID=UPI00084AAC88|nr:MULTISPECIES: hypothetical protein [Pseudomonas]OEC42692.1 hypothetical protein A7D27_10970 [Pseudomonas sp. 1D4]